MSLPESTPALDDLSEAELKRMKKNVIAQIKFEMEGITLTKSQKNLVKQYFEQLNLFKTSDSHHEHFKSGEDQWRSLLYAMVTNKMGKDSTHRVAELSMMLCELKTPLTVNQYMVLFHYTNPLYEVISKLARCMDATADRQKRIELNKLDLTFGEYFKCATELDAKFLQQHRTNHFIQLVSWLQCLYNAVKEIPLHEQYGISNLLVIQNAIICLHNISRELCSDSLETFVTNIFNPIYETFEIIEPACAKKSKSVSVKNIRLESIKLPIVTDSLDFEYPSDYGYSEFD